MKFADEIKRVITGDTRKIEVFGKQECQQDANGSCHSLPGDGGMLLLVELTGCLQFQYVPFRPPTHPRQQDDSEQNRKRKPSDAGLALRKHNDCREQGTQSETSIASKLKEGLGQTVLSS